MNKVKDFFKEAYDVLKKPEVRILPGNLAFFMVFSIIPIFTLIIFIASSFSLEMIVSTLDSVIPEAVISAVTNFIHSDAFSFANSVTLIISFLLISNGANSLIITTNTLYGIEPNSILKTRVKSLFLAIVLLLLFSFTIFVLGFGNSIISFVISFAKLEMYSYYIVLLIKWPLSLLLLYFMVKIIYTMTPDERILSKYMSKGSLFTAMAWLVLTEIYVFYITYIADYAQIYGSLASIIILMVWIYILSYAMVLGIGMNVNYYHRCMNKKKKK